MLVAAQGLVSQVLAFPGMCMWFVSWSWLVGEWTATAGGHGLGLLSWCAVRVGCAVKVVGWGGMQLDL
ncbi:hypothetical protein U1Q18_032144 [Sarracenia purpurea var. burkii]